jgi:hypothetical protein
LQGVEARGVMRMSRKNVIMIVSVLVLSIMAFVLSACQSTTPSTTATTGGVRFTFFDADKSILSGVKIVSQKQPEGQLKVTGITTQDPNGTTINDLKQGDYVFYFSKADYQDVSLSINIVVGQTYGLDTTLSKLPAGATKVTPTSN